MVTVGLEPTLLTALRLFGQVRNTRLASLSLAILVYSPRFRLASSFRILNLLQIALERQSGLFRMTRSLHFGYADSALR